ncbi:MAG: L-alanine-DL-glutamate epimerase-like enolase superfamily enzyme [Candidatus Poriferisodalaceae bacterium]|jgi:L-alanine-DL-glutamate epimerase-like enolase superfamily enzyme
MFGSCRDRVDTYASSGLWLSQSIDDIAAEAMRFLGQGFRTMKVRLGSANPAEDVSRVRAVRAAVGDDVGLLVALNQGLTPQSAIQLARRLEEFDLVWIQEPVNAHDLAGHALVRRSIDQHVATGETLYTSMCMQQILDAEATDILMPDLQRIGGYTEMRRACAVARTRHVPVSTHFLTGHSLSVAGSESNIESVEHVDCLRYLFNETIDLEDGQLLIPQRLGTGFTFTDSVRAQLR